MSPSPKDTHQPGGTFHPDGSEHPPDPNIHNENAHPGAESAPPPPPSESPSPISQTVPSAVSGASESAGGPFRRMLLMAVAVILIIGGGLGLFLWYQDRDLGPTATFDAMLENSLDIKTVNQKITSNAGIINVELVADTDYSDVQMPKIDADLTMSINFFTTASFDLEMVILDDDAYVRYTDVSVSGGLGEEAAEDPIPAEALNRWAKVIEDGEALGGDSGAIDIDEFSSDLGTALTGVFLIGDFTDEQDQTIYDFIKERNIYSFDEMSVGSETVNGEETYKYDVTVDSEAMRELVKKIATEMMGMTEAEADAFIAQSEFPDKLTMWAGKKSKQLVKLEAETEGIPVIAEYANHNESVDIQAPETDITAEELTQLLDGDSSSSSSDSSSSSGSSLNADTEIRTDVNSIHTQLEVFYADNGFYPTDSSDFSVTKFPGISPDALVAPDGTSVSDAAGAYSYTGTDCFNGGCNSYSLSATLSDGSSYTKLSLN